MSLAQDKQLRAQFMHGSGAMATITTEQFGELVASMMALSQALSANAQIAAAILAEEQIDVTVEAGSCP